MKKRKKLMIWINTLPAMILIGAIIVFPILYTAYISFTNMNLFHWNDYKFVGIENYVRALFKVDAGFLSAILTTILWTILNMVIQVVVAFFIALGLNTRGLKLKNVYKTLLMFPWAMPAYVSILLWKVGIYNTEFGLANKVLSALGFDKVNYLASNVPAFIFCMVLNLWMALPFMIMMFRQNARSFPVDIIEAARIDGLSEVRIFFQMFIPTMKSTYAAAAVITFMNAWNSYLWPKVIMTDNKAMTMPMLIANLITGYVTDYGMLMCGVLFCSIPTMVVFFVLQKQFAEGITGAVK